MIERSLVRVALNPSLFSGIVCGLITVFLLGANSWAQIVHSPLVANSLVDPASATAAVTKFTGDFGTWLGTLLAQAWFYYVVLTAAAIIISISVFVGLQVASRTATNLTEAISDAQISGEKLNHTLGESMGVRILIRIVVFISLLLYWQLSAVVLGPLCMMLWSNGMSNAGRLVGWVELSFAAVALFAVIHVFVVLLRLLFLRPRVFGGKYEILGALE